MCDTKNSVLFTDTKCLVLSPEFKLPDENQVLLRVPRENNMYNVNLKNIIPSRDLPCLFAKATLDKYNLWHRRLGHINLKTMNKLVKGNLVRGLPSKVFENNHTCVACKKGKQYRASCKTKLVSSVSQPLKGYTYCLVVTDDYSRFTWVFFLATKDETSPTLRTFITGIENQLSLKREFSVPRTPQRNGIAKRKNMTLIEAARTMLADLLLPIPFWVGAIKTACYVQNRNTNDDAAFEVKEPDFEGRKPESKVHVSLSSSAQIKKHDDKTKKEAKGKSHVELSTRYRNLSAEFEDFSNNSINEVNAAGSLVPAVGPTHGKSSYVDTSQYPDDLNMPALEDITYSDDDEDVGAEADFTNLETTITFNPIPTTRVHKDHYVTQIIGDLCLATQTRSMTRVVKDQGGLTQINNEDFHTCMFACFLLQEEPKREEGIDYEEVFAPVERIEAIRLFLAYASFMGYMVYQMDVKSAFLYETIEEEVYVCQPLVFEDPDYLDKAEAVNTTCYVQNRVLVTKPHNKTPYELFHGRTPSMGFMRPFGYHVTIFNTLDSLGKFDGKVDEGFLVGYSSSGSTNPHNTDGDVAFDEKESEFEGRKLESEVNVSPSNFSDNNINEDSAAGTLVPAIGQLSPNSTNTFSVVGPSNAAAGLTHRKSSCIDTSQLLDDPDMLELEDIIYSDDEDDVGTEADINNLETSITVSPIPTTRVHKDHPVTQIIGDLSSATQKRKDDSEAELTQNALSFVQPNEQVKTPRPSVKPVETSILAANHKTAIPKTKTHRNNRNRKACFVLVLTKSKLVPLTTVRPVTTATPQPHVTRPRPAKTVVTKHISPPRKTINHRPSPPVSNFPPKVIAAKASKNRVLVTKPHNKTPYELLHGRTPSSVPTWLFDIDTLTKTMNYQPVTAGSQSNPSPGVQEQFDVEKAIPTIGQLFPNSTNTFSVAGPSNAVAGLTHRKSSYVKSAFLYGTIEEEVYVYQPPGFEDPDYPDKDKYVAEILRKFRLTDGKSASTPIDTEKPFLKDPDVKRIFRYLKGKPHLGLWYLKDSPLDLVAYSYSDYAGASLDRKSITAGCQFLRCRLISWQCKKQIVVATSSTEAEYVAAASCCSLAASTPKLDSINIQMINTLYNPIEANCNARLIVESQSQNRDDDKNDEALTWCNFHVQIVGIDDGYEMPWKDLMKLMIDVYCLMNEIQKLENELWNLCVKGKMLLDCKTVVDAQTPRAHVANQRVVTRFRCDGHRHYKIECPKLKNQNHGNKAANNDARGALIDITPTALEVRYDVELADGRIVEFDTIIRGCTLNLLDHLFNINLLPVELGNEILKIKGDGRDDGSNLRLNIISWTKTQKYIQRGCHVFLAHISVKKTEDKSEEKRLEYVPIVQDFPKHELLIDLHHQRCKCNTPKIERFNTLVGNHVKEILFKLNLPDHRSILTYSKVTSTKYGRITKPYSSPRFIAKHFNAVYLKMEVKSKGHKCTRWKRLQDGKKRLCLVDDLKKLKITFMSNQRYKSKSKVNDHYAIVTRERKRKEVYKHKNEDPHIHELKQEMHADLNYVESLKKEINELES
nr:hypothetical protein [Tanacetum cinerariifolium]